MLPLGFRVEGLGLPRDSQEVGGSKLQRTLWADKALESPRLPPTLPVRAGWVAQNNFRATLQVPQYSPPRLPKAP